MALLVFANILCGDTASLRWLGLAGIYDAAGQCDDQQGGVFMLLWGAVALGGQIMVYLLVRQTFKGLTEAFEEGMASNGMFLAACFLAAGILNAACMSH